MSATSPLAVPFPDAPTILGATPRIARAHYKDWDRCDLTFVELVQGTAVAGVTTHNVCCSTEVELCREHLKGGRARALGLRLALGGAAVGVADVFAAD